MNTTPTVRAARMPADSTLAELARWDGARRSDRQRLWVAALPAALLHLGLLAIHLPEGAPVEVKEPDRPVFVVQPFRPKPPQPPVPEDPPSPRTRQADIPIPVPEAPEPIRQVEVLPDPEPLTIPEDAVVETAIPDPPPLLEVPASDPGPILVGGDVQKPVKLFGPDPIYTEVARKAREAGRVIVQATIDKEGRVVDLEVLRGLRFGLTENTLAAMRQWRFEPATLHGEPVAVLFTLTVEFHLQ